MSVNIIYFLHLLGAIAAGYYLVFPFLISRVRKLSAAAQEGYINGMYIFNRIGQYIFIAQFITGGYLISKAKYEVVWIVVVLVVFFILGALAGMMGKPMRQMTDHIKTGKDIGGLVRKLIIYSIVITVCFLILVTMMFFPAYR